MEAMDGPVNFGERDKNWGLLIDGFVEQNYGMNYNAPYYKQLFEGYGFGLYFNQYTYGRDWDQKNDDLEPRFYERAQKALDNPDITFRYLTKKEFKKAHAYFHRSVYQGMGRPQGCETHDARTGGENVQKAETHCRFAPLDILGSIRTNPSPSISPYPN
jgi:hypothetical protein